MIDNIKSSARFHRKFKAMEMVLESTRKSKPVYARSHIAIYENERILMNYKSQQERAHTSSKDFKVLNFNRIVKPGRRLKSATVPELMPEALKK